MDKATEASTRLYLNWLATAQPLTYARMVKRLPPDTQAAVAAVRGHRSGLGALGDASTDGSTSDSSSGFDFNSFLSDITGTVTAVSTAIGTTAQQTSLAQTNLARAQQGLAPISSLPATPTVVATAPKTLLGLSYMTWGIIAAAGVLGIIAIKA